MPANLKRIQHNMMKQAVNLSKKSKKMNEASGVIPPSMEALVHIAASALGGTSAAAAQLAGASK